MNRVARSPLDGESDREIFRLCGEWIAFFSLDCGDYIVTALVSDTYVSYLFERTHSRV